MLDAASALALEDVRVGLGIPVELTAARELFAGAMDVPVPDEPEASRAVAPRIVSDPLQTGHGLPWV